VKVEDGRAQFDVDEMLENLSSTTQVELADYSEPSTHFGWPVTSSWRIEASIRY
jgi:hypothetical protein